MNILQQLKLNFVKNIYATHNNSFKIKRALAEVFNILKNTNSLGLNVGSGNSKLHPSIINLDIYPFENVHCCSDAVNLPFKNHTFDLVISQETLEHIRDPNLVLGEIYRVLKKKGILYLQLPFIIGYHPGPADFWRFTKEGIEELVIKNDFNILKIEIAVGPATGFYRIIVEFGAVLISSLFPKGYLLFKGMFALLFYPIKLLDIFMIHSKNSDRIAGGYYIIAEKK